MNATASNRQDASARLLTLLSLIDELITIIHEENSALATGLPASQSKHLARKTELAGQFEQWVAEVTSDKVSLFHANEPLRTAFVQRTKVLQMLMDDNIVKLRAAIEASQRRIDAVMGAIRAHISDTTPYTASGRAAGAAASYAANIRA